MRSPRIDLLRGIAIVLVMLLHYSLTYRLSQSPLAEWIGTNGVRTLIVNGNYGVTIFFAISGFLITSYSLRRAGSLAALDLRQFYVFRFARIMPTLSLALCVIATLGLLGIPSFMNHAHGQDLPASYFVLAIFSVLTFWHNVLMEMTGYFNYCLNIYWSLSVEEIFYLMFPLAAVFLRRTGWFVAACVLLIALAPAYRAAHADEELYFMYGYLACFDAIAIGCIAALIKPRLQLSAALRNVITLAAASGLVVVYAMGIDHHEVWGFSGIALATGLLLLTAPDQSTRSLAGARFWAPLRWFGSHSYELYLFHIVVLACMRDLVHRDALAASMKLPWLGVFFALSALLAAMTARWFSEPMNRLLRQHFTDARALAAAQA